MSARHNWAGNVVFQAAEQLEPATVDELAEVVRRAPKVRVLGSGHSFNEVADTTGALVSLGRLEPRFELSPERSSVTVSGAMRYAAVTAGLERAGFALHNLGSLPHISVAGACSTGTHGSGSKNGGLATAVRGVELLTGSGELLRLDRGDRRFNGAVVALGALGAVVALELEVMPSFRMRQVVYEGLRASALDDHLEDILDAAYSVSLFTSWRSRDVDQVWCKFLEAEDVPDDLFGARPATVSHHPIDGVSAESCTEQLGALGPWNERLPHFRAEFTPSKGDELQSEYLIERAYAPEALRAVAALSSEIAPLLLVSEIRTVAADELWLSPSYRQSSLALHFTWIRDPAAVGRLLPGLEAALAPFAPRPHWGKVFTTPAAAVLERYERAKDFATLRDELDPAGKFTNAFVGAFFPLT